MKTLNEIRYFFFAAIVLGCFANFAQNEYGLDMIYDSALLIGCTFFIEAFAFYAQTRSESKTKAIYFFVEHFILGCIFLGQYFKRDPLLPPGPFLIFGAFLLFILYLIYAVRTLVKDSKKGRFMAFMVFLFILTSVIAANGLSWKLQHLPGANIMLNIAFYSGLFLVVFPLIKRKYTYANEQMAFKERVMKLPGKIPMVFVYYTLWAAHISLTMYGITPNFYTLSNPPAYEKMRTANDPKAVDYNDNYYKFLGNRNHIQYR